MANKILGDDVLNATVVNKVDMHVCCRCIHVKFLLGWLDRHQTSELVLQPADSYFCTFRWCWTHAWSMRCI